MVEWDTGSVFDYRYGSSIFEKDKYDVIVCDEPRMLENELIAVGCLVKRGIVNETKLILHSYLQKNETVKIRNDLFYRRSRLEVGKSRWR